MKYYDKSIELNKNDAANYFFKGIFCNYLANLLLAMEKFEEAVAIYNTALILNPNMIELYNSKGYFYIIN